MIKYMRSTIIMKDSEQTGRRPAMIYHRICEAYICELLKKKERMQLNEVFL